MRTEKWICYAIGYVFIVSGIMKLIMGGALDLFHNLGIPYPETSVFLLSIVEIGCGAFIVARLYIKQAVIPLVIVMIGAIVLTKIPVLLGDGVLSFLFSSRLEVILLVFLLLLWSRPPEKILHKT